jgi:co-chaperonin GroES (HSP10)
MTQHAVARLHLAGPEDLDCAAEMDRAVGDLSAFDLFGEQILIGQYMRGDKTAGGIIIPDNANQTEDQFQGKVARILKIGSGCYGHKLKLDGKTVETDEWGKPITQMKYLDAMGGVPLKVGDWIFTHWSNRFHLSVRGPGAVDSKLIKNKAGASLPGWPVALVYLSDVYGRIADPLMVV